MVPGYANWDVNIFGDCEGVTGNLIAHSTKTHHAIHDIKDEVMPGLTGPIGEVINVTGGERDGISVKMGAARTVEAIGFDSAGGEFIEGGLVSGGAFSGRPIDPAIEGEGVSKFVDEDRDGISLVAGNGCGAQKRGGVKPELIGEIVGTDIELDVRFRAIGIDPGADFCRCSLFPDVTNAIVVDEDGSSAGAGGGGYVEPEVDLDFQRDVFALFKVFCPGRTGPLDGRAEIVVI